MAVERRSPNRDRSRALRGVLAITVSAAAMTTACKPEEARVVGPDTTSPVVAVAAHIEAPTLLHPAPGSELASANPTLMVENAATSDGSTLTYAFEVSVTPDFENPIAETQGVTEDPSGETSWVVDGSLEDASYFWRARGVNDRGVAGPYSEVAGFTIAGSTLVVADSLTDGTSVGVVGGGKFVSQGWKVTSKSDFIRYAVPTLTSGFVEWETLGLRTVNPAPDNVMLLGMWDASPEAGPYRTNAFRVHLRKLDETLEPPLLRLRWIANGEQHDTGTSLGLWDPGRVYRWRLEWGPSTQGNTVRVLLDDVPILLQPYTREYAPRLHRIELGVEQRQESIVGVVYSNVRIGRR